MTPRRAARAPARRMRERGPRYTPAIAEPVVVDASITFLWFANELGHPVYDCLYLALAAAHAASIATAEERLRQAAKRIGVRIKTSPRHYPKVKWRADEMSLGINARYYLSFAG